MCSFRLNFSDFNVLFFQKIKTCCSLLLKKVTCLPKREKKNNLSQGKITAPHPLFETVLLTLYTCIIIVNVRSLRLNNEMIAMIH